MYVQTKNARKKDLGNFYEVEFISCILDSSLVSKVAKSNSLANNHIETVQFPSENSKILEVVFANFKIMLIHEVKRHLKLNSADQMTEVHSRAVRPAHEKRRGEIFSNFGPSHLVDGKMQSSFSSSSSSLAVHSALKMEKSASSKVQKHFFSI